MKKKIFGVLFAAMLVFGMVGAAGAVCDGPDCHSSGELGEVVGAGSLAIDCDDKSIPNGSAFGISGAGGGTLGWSNGDVFFHGDVDGYLDVWGGGLTNTDAYRFTPQQGDIGIGVGSHSESYALTNGYGDIYTNVGPGVGYANMTLFGIAAQGTLNASQLGSSPLPMWDSNGKTKGCASQGSIGAWGGDADVFVSGWGDAGAGLEAELSMGGDSWSESYRYIDWNDGAKTEGMGTNVGARTSVDSYGYGWDDSCACGPDYADSHVGGGFIAGGAVKSTTVQTNGLGGAFATANGAYVGAGELGCNYDGSAVGGTYTSITTVNGMKGSINRAGASMSVTSRVNGGEQTR